MKTHIVLAAVLFSLTRGLTAAEGKPVPAAKGGEFASFKTADDLWKHVESLREEPNVQPKSEDEMLAMVREWFGKQRAAAEAFGAAYPADARRHAAKLIALQAGVQLSQLPGADPAKKVGADAVLKEIDAILAAADAPEDAKGEAAFIQTTMLTEKPETIAAFFKAADAYLAKYGAHKLAPQMRQMQFGVASQERTPEAEAVLKSFAENKDPQIAGAAKEVLAQRQKMAELKTRPLELKFTATDGSEVDVAKLRGKVVLLDFWASWCGPCIAEMPNVVAAYNKLHGKGFEILGISLDEDKAKMEAAAKKHAMTWVQYFDGKGWQNKISSDFGIQSIPAAWLLDKKGVLRETDLRGAALGASVEKLLAE